jgi:hypothetical protein
MTVSGVLLNNNINNPNLQVIIDNINASIDGASEGSDVEKGSLIETQE